MIYFVVYFIGWVLGISVYLMNPEKGFVTSLLLSHLVFCVGFFGVFNFIGHAKIKKKVAKSIGWVSNGFQKELDFGLRRQYLSLFFL
jgi:hypothetical protein